MYEEGRAEVCGEGILEEGTGGGGYRCVPVLCGGGGGEGR